MGRKKVWESASEQDRASRKRREGLDSVKALKLMQFSLTLEDKFVLEDLREAWGVQGIRGGLPAPERGRKAVSERTQNGSGKAAGETEETNRIMIRNLRSQNTASKTKEGVRRGISEDVSCGRGGSHRTP